PAAPAANGDSDRARAATRAARWVNSFMVMGFVSKGGLEGSGVRGWRGGTGQRVLARERQGLAQHVTLADVVGKDQHELGGQHVGLLVAQVALARDQFFVEAVG